MALRDQGMGAIKPALKLGPPGPDASIPIG